ncbi:qcr9 subunit 9 of the ubiquinol cytochrome-c reductase complex, partial [Tieghemiomyces parasiticus]
MSGAASLNRTIYNTFFKRNSVFVGTILVSAYVFQLSFDGIVNRWYANRNKG